MAYKVGMISLGCSKNQVDAEHMLADLAKDGFVISNDPSICDAVIVNTCGFIEDAKRESIESIFEMAQYKKSNLKVLAVTGCLAERYQKEFSQSVPEADVILGMGSMKNISSAISSALNNGEKVISFGEKTDFSMEGERILTTASFFAYLKVADGCDNRCSFCAIPNIRGHFRSRKQEDIIAEAKKLAENGVREINVVAQDTTRYGRDIYGKYALPELLLELCKIEKLEWVRLLYCYPDTVTDELIEVIASQPKIVKYIDIPLQHISNNILKKMRRRSSKEDITILLNKMREKIPNVVIRTTMIAGFPGETNDDFAELCEYIKEHKFERLGCFAYSQEEDTIAGEMEDQIDIELRRRRAEMVMSLQMEVAHNLAKSLIGKTFTVLNEGFDQERNLYYGRSYMDAPDIDTKVYFSANEKIAPGDFVQVYIEEAKDYDLIGKQA